MPDRGLGLDGDELRAVLDGVDGPSGVGDLPDHHGGDLDRVAVGVVDLGLRRLLVADPGRDRGARVNGFTQLHARVRTVPVPAEQLHDPGLAGDDSGQPGQREGSRR